MKKVVLLAFALCYVFVGKAQQDPQLTHFMFDKLSYNPASAGFKDAFCLTAINRQQWTGLNAGEPSTTLINVTTPSLGLIKGGLGFSYYNDQIGWETNNVMRLSYSLHLSQINSAWRFGPGELGIGLSASYFSKNINAAWIPPNTPIGPNPGQDNSIPSATASESGLSFNMGLYYGAPNFYIGASATNLTETELKTLKITGARHYYLMGGYEYSISDFTIRPNVLMKSDGVKTQYDLNLNVLAYNLFWVGATYRHNDAIAPMAGVQWKGFQLGYSYGLGTSFLGNYFTSGNHEVMLNFCFNIIPEPKYEREVHPYLL